MKNGKKQVAVIGAGPSGMIAAIMASRAGCDVTVYEKQKKTGRKLAVTGNGQCNISNRNIDVSRYHGENPRFVRNVFARFGLEHTIDFFEEIGIPFVEKKQGKMYPCSLQAQSVVDILEYEVQHAGAELCLHRRVDRIEPDGNFVYISTAGHESLSYDSVIIAAGGCAYPQLGGGTIGYDLAASLGHAIVSPFPSILPLNVPLKILHRLEGIKWDVDLTVRCDGKTTGESSGELLFARYGISGPASLEISRAVNEALVRGQKPEIIINLFPARKAGEIRDLFDSLFSDRDRVTAFALSGVLKKRIPDIFVTIAGIDPAKKCGALTAHERRKIVEVCTSLVLEPGPMRPFSEAVVAAGGIAVDEVDPMTMESKKAKGVYLCGEMLDIDGDSGGFNLQFAWSSGAVAGMAQKA
jgi:predicted Rossmann fold flavoprotein